MAMMVARIYIGDNPGANRWFLKSTLTQTLPPGGSIYEKLTSDLPLGCLQGGFDLVEDGDDGGENIRQRGIPDQLVCVHFHLLGN